jgi:hypothetical protein
MIIGFFLAVAVLIGLFAMPWQAPAPSRRISHTFLVVLAALIQIPVLFYGRPPFGPLLGAILIGLWSLYNRRLPGAWLLLAGVVANAVAMLYYGGAMPLHPEAARALGLKLNTYGLLVGSKDVIGRANLLIWLGDWIVIKGPGVRLVSSPGDIGIVIGLLCWVRACRVTSVVR